ncbi:MAG: DUF6515 family protein [Gammaproteobacteria bacterium]
MTPKNNVPRVRAIVSDLRWAAMLALVFAAALAASIPAHAQNREGRGFGGGAQMHLDNRFSHNQYYHDRGYSVPGVPRGAYEIHHGGGSYLYHGGEWYGRRGGVSVVIGAPIGAFVPVLPPYYSTVWWGGVPYYYADDAYYTWDAGESQYQVVDPPTGIESGGTTAAPQTDTVFIYPKNGQSEEQQATDRYECHRFAVRQSGYDPTVSGGGVQADEATNKRSDYMRAQAACLDARGYSVK